MAGPLDRGDDPTKRDAPTAATAEASKTQESEKRRDSAAGESLPQPTEAAERKREATIRARLALLGVAMHALDAGGFLLAWPRGGLTREVRDLDAAERVLDAMGRRS